MGPTADAAGVADRGSVVAAVAHPRPAVVAAGDDAVQLVAALRAVLVHPEFVGPGADRRALRVAVPVAPDLRPGAGDGRVVGRDGSIAADPDHLAERGLKVLGRRPLLPLTKRHEERLVGPERDAGTEVAASRHLGHLPVEHRDALEGAAHELPAGHGGPREPGLGSRPGLRVGPVHPRVGGEVRVERDVEEAALPVRDHRRQAGQGRLQGAVGPQDDHRAALLRHERPAVREEGETPGRGERRIQRDHPEGRAGGASGTGRPRRTARGGGGVGAPAASAGGEEGGGQDRGADASGGRGGSRGHGASHNRKERYRLRASWSPPTNAFAPATPLTLKIPWRSARTENAPVSTRS